MPSLTLLRWFYVLSLGSLGAVMPYLSARLEAAGLGGMEIGALMAMLPLGRLVSAPLWGWAADRFGLAGILLRVGCAMALAGGIVLLWSERPMAAAAGLLLFSAGRVPLGPLVDAATIRVLSGPGGDPRDYGRVRLWGSGGFLVLAIAAALVADAGGDPMWPGVALLAATLLISFAFPARGGGGPAPVLPALVSLARQPFLAPLLVLAALQALTLSVYDTFFGAHVRALGLPATVTAAAIAVGVLFEIAVMRFGRLLLIRWGAPRALLFAALAGIPRWWLTATVVSPIALVGAQALHGVSFGVFWIAGVQMMAERAPIRVAASAQSLFVAASYGVGALAGALLAGAVRERWDTAAIFLLLTGVSMGAALAAGVLVRREAETAGRPLPE